MNNKEHDEIVERLKREQAENKVMIMRKRAEEDMLDEDGYPTADALWCIQHWPWDDSTGWFEFIKSIWCLSSWGWCEGEKPHDWDKDKMTYRYDISTAGWSGNESVIEYMEKNHMLWHLTWVQSRRGGHYIFEKKVFEDDAEV